MRTGGTFAPDYGSRSAEGRWGGGGKGVVAVRLMIKRRCRYEQCSPPALEGWEGVGRARTSTTTGRP